MDHIQQKNNPLHGKTLAHVVTRLSEHYGWAELGYLLRFNCFIKDPSVNSSLKFLRKQAWARKQVEQLYIDTFNH
ncbi:VF530 family protein [Pedobacter nanyangensis]|uniref:VF530 family protein n=1 Tax=Pedobacter nanyangensis TaxID=1562389 RepID=UPI000DE34A1F|nr:VF530 family protein [Pedobacter nanyangensis]